MSSTFVLVLSGFNSLQFVNFDKSLHTWSSLSHLQFCFSLQNMTVTTSWILQFCGLSDLLQN